MSTLDSASLDTSRKGTSRNIAEMATPQEQMRISLVQSELHWHDAAANYAMFADLLTDLQRQTDIVILPEMFTTGFSMVPADIAENAEGDTLIWMQNQARRLDAVVCGSVAVRYQDEFFNRFYWVEPSGRWQKYDKHHLFRMAGEHLCYSAGQERLVIRYRGWRILPQVCYDLRFPVWSRNRDDYDLAIYVANWPEVREHPWQVLLQARAIENLSYVAGVNRVGCDGNGLVYSGRSALIDFKGQQLAGGTPGTAFIQTVALSYQALLDFRHAFPAFADADVFSIESRSSL